jgi:hypothetical protein
MAERVGEVGRLLPKSLFPISAGDTLLTRNLRWLLLAGCANILISTNPDQYEIVEWSVRRFLGALSSAPSLGSIPSIKVLSNKQHAVGPVHALATAAAAAATGSDGLLYCLSDICFLANPFTATTASPTSTVFARSGDGVNYLSQGGVAIVRKQVCCRLCLRPEDCIQEPDEEKYLWSGMAMLDHSALQELHRFVSSIPQAVEEDYINRCISTGQSFERRDVPGFVNVNTFEDYRVAISLVADGGRSQ